MQKSTVLEIVTIVAQTSIDRALSPAYVGTIT